MQVESCREVVLSVKLMIVAWLMKVGRVPIPAIVISWSTL